MNFKHKKLSLHTYKSVWKESAYLYIEFFFFKYTYIIFKVFMGFEGAMASPPP